MNNQVNQSSSSIYSTILSFVRAMPIIGNALVKVASLPMFNKFQTSKQYWEDRYQKGGNSGPGSYGRLSIFKAKVINEFCEINNVKSIAELGSGDGSQLELLNIQDYTGVDISEHAVEKMNIKYSNDKSRNFLILDDFKTRNEKFDAVMSLDVIYHLVEDQVFTKHMQQLFHSASKYVIIYSSNKNNPVADPHVRHRMFSDWINENAKNWQLKTEIANRYPFDWKDSRNTSFANFYIYEKTTR